MTPSVVVAAKPKCSPRGTSECASPVCYPFLMQMHHVVRFP